VSVVSPLIVVIARRDSRGRDLAIETVADGLDERRRASGRFALPTSIELPAWHEHEEDD
jgi:hypothetical protein